MVDTSTETLPIVRSKVMPFYKVILHNDDHNSMVYVVRILMRYIDHMTNEKANSVMFAAHKDGKSIVTLAPLERAEYYQGCLNGAGLTSTIEKA